MGACALAIGSKGKIAIKQKTGTFEDGSPAALGAGDGYPCLSCVIDDGTVEASDEELAGEVFEGHPEPIAEQPSGTAEMRLDYRRALRWLALAMGVSPAPTEDEAGVRYTHALRLADCNSVFATFGADKVATGGVGTGWRWAAAKLNGFTLGYQQGQELRLQVPLLLRGLAARNLDASGWTIVPSIETAPQLVLPSQGVLRVKAQGGGAFGGGDVIRRPMSLQFTFGGNLAGELLSGDSIDEPQRNAKPNAKLQLGFSALTTEEMAIFRDAFDARPRTKLKADFTFTGRTLGGGTYKLLLQFPSLTVQRAPADLQGPGRIPFPVELHCGPDVADASGMAITRPFGIDLTNATATQALA